MRTRWEYTTLKLTMDLGFLSGADFDPAEVTKQLNHFGKDGWELVSTFPVDQPRGETRYVCALFKRELLA